MIPQNNLQEFKVSLLDKIDIIDLINSYTPLRKKSNNNYFARCPFHQEKSASFSVSQQKQFYYCFGCGAHGNAIDFLINHERLTFIEALEQLARTAGMEIPRDSHYVKPDESIPKLHDFMEIITQHYYEQMCQSDRAISYIKQRGLSGQITKQFLLGYAPNHFTHLLDQFGQTAEGKKQLLDAGLIIQKEDGKAYDRFRDRILFPIHNYRGRLIGFGGRILDQGEPKYLNSPETILFQKGQELYGLYHALQINRALDRVIVVEGYMDVIALFEHGITYAVATLGTATTSHHLKRLFRYTSEIIFCFDGDQAGKTAAWRALEVTFPLLNDQLQIRFHFLPEGEDPDSLVQKIGKTQFEAELSQAMPLSTFFFQTLAKQKDINTIEGRAGFISDALTFIKQLPPGPLQQIFMDELGKRARLDISDLRKTLPSQAAVAHAQTKIGHKIDPTLRLALALIIQEPKLALEIKTPLPTIESEDFALFLQLIQLINDTPDMTTAKLREQFRDQAEEELINELANLTHHIPEADVSTAFLGTLNKLAIQSLDQAINSLLAKAGTESLTSEEKLSLSKYISQKKTLSLSYHQ